MAVVDFAELKALVPAGRLMALDVGSKTIGIATSDALRMLASWTADNARIPPIKAIRRED